tara:strand:- start:6683 stop:7510 length:828 start_codon:yes stop_codon:yes gene_type:complete
MNWQEILKEESKWMNSLSASKQKLLDSEPSFEVDIPKLSFPDNEEELPKVLKIMEGQDLDKKTINDLDKNNHKMMLDIVGEKMSDWKDFIEDVDIHTIRLKMKYGRKRPYEISDKIKSVTNTDDTPSFPSGHAIEAYALAKVLGEKYPDKKKELNIMADSISLSRVQMGNHYPSDIEAGKKVGLMLADAYLDISKSWEDILQSGDNFKREKAEGLHGWFSRRGGKGKSKGWVSCSSCGKKDGPKPCGRKDASKGRKRRCRPTCGACKTYKRRKGK